LRNLNFKKIIKAGTIKPVEITIYVVKGGCKHKSIWLAASSPLVFKRFMPVWFISVPPAQIPNNTQANLPANFATSALQNCFIW
jgi:hypothetical protein